MNPGQQQRHWVGLALVLLGALGFSTKAILIKLAYAEGGQLEAITLMALRMLFSFPFFLVVAVWRRNKSTNRPITVRHWFLLGGLGLIGYYLSSYLDFLGLRYISAGLERIILFLYPTFVIIYSAAFFKRRVPLRLMAALTLSYLGLAMALVGNVSAASSDIFLGSALVLASAALFAGFTLGSGQLSPLLGSVRFTAYTMTFASLATLIHASVASGLALTDLPMTVYVLASSMAIFSTVLPAFLMNAGIQRLGAGPASIISTVGPIMTLALADWLLGETISHLQLAGTVLVLAGVYTARKLNA